MCHTVEKRLHNKVGGRRGYVASMHALSDLLTDVSDDDIDGLAGEELANSVERLNKASTA